MWGIYSYLISIMIFAGLAVLLEWIFGYHRLKKAKKTIGLVVLIFLAFTPVGEFFALRMKIWQYNPLTTFYTTFIGAELETYVFALFTGLAISSAVIAWTNYEDEKKNIIIQSLIDVFKGTYAIWRKEK